MAKLSQSFSKYVTLTDIRKPITLQTPVDNSDGNLSVALVSAIYQVRRYTVQADDSIKVSITVPDTQPVKRVYKIPPGNYTPSELIGKINYNVKSILKKSKYSYDDGIIYFIKSTGFMKLKVPEHVTLELSEQFAAHLGFEQTMFTDNTFTGAKPYFSSKIVYVYMDELSTDENILDGLPSTLLTVASIDINDKFNKMETIRFENPTFHKLRRGMIDSFNVSLIEGGRVIGEHPIIITLEIK